MSKRKRQVQHLVSFQEPRRPPAARPGGDQPADSSGSLTKFVLERETELRIEVEGTVPAQVELVSGFAEVFGAELPLCRRYTFPPGSRASVFTWYGCTVHFWGSPNTAYVSANSSTRFLLNTHVGLEQMRMKAECEGKRGPRVMVVGPSGVGKSTLCQLLLNYAVRGGRRPTLIELDVGQGSLSVPGTVAALHVQSTSDIVRGFSGRTPLAFHFGSTTPETNVNLYNKLASRLAHVLNQRCRFSRVASISGCVINTCGWLRGSGHQALIHAATAFEVDLVLVLGEERLYHLLCRYLPQSIRKVNLTRYKGATERFEECRREYQEQKIRDYFYGPDGSFYPYAFELKYSDVHVYKVRAPAIPESGRPIGMSPDSDVTLVAVTPGRDMAYHLFSVILTESKGEERSLEERSVAGFIAISEVDTKNKTLKVLSPLPSPLPKCKLLMMDVTFIDA